MTSPSMQGTGGGRQQLARNQLLLRAQITDHEQRLEAIESHLGDTGRNVTPDQASQISPAVKKKPQITQITQIRMPLLPGFYSSPAHLYI